MYPQNTRVRAGELRAQGLSYEEIARELEGVSSRTVRRWLPDQLPPEQAAAAEARRLQRSRETKRNARPTPAPIPGVLWVYHRGEWLRALVDLDIWHRLRGHRWHTAAQLNYPVTTFNGRNEYLHRLVFGLLPGARWPDGERIVVDHLNRDTLDNRRVNLRLGTQKDNCANRGGKFEKVLRAA